MKETSEPTVHILLATYNGAKHLEEQLESIGHQTYKKWHLHVSDDGSNDDTWKILEKFKNNNESKTELMKGPKEGPTKNFLKLIRNFKHQNQNDLYAFCDQDDVWLPEKIETAVHYHNKNPSEKLPKLYCSRTIITDEKLREIGPSKAIKRAPSFGNALIQNIASGNTMVFNTALLNILQRIKPEHSVWHDWTAYIATMACAGEVFYDSQPRILYRQHAQNVIGTEKGLTRRIINAIRHSKNKYEQWWLLNGKALSDIEPLMDAKISTSLQAYNLFRKGNNGTLRLKYALKAKLHRQTHVETALFYSAIIFNLV